MFDAVRVSDMVKQLADPIGSCSLAGFAVKSWSRSMRTRPLSVIVHWQHVELRGGAFLFDTPLVTFEQVWNIPECECCSTLAAVDDCKLAAASWLSIRKGDLFATG